MRKLTQREKVLIYIAVVLLLLSGGYYLVKLPSDSIRMAAEAELKILQLQAEGKGKPSEESALKRKIDEKMEIAGRGWEDYLSYRPNSMLLPEITSRITAFGITPEAMEVTEVSALEDKAAAKEGYTIYKAVVRIKAAGTTEDLYRLLDWTNSRDWISVTAYSRNRPVQAATASSAQESEEESGPLNLTVTCLMLELSETGQPENESRMEN